MESSEREFMSLEDFASARLRTHFRRIELKILGRENELMLREEAFTRKILQKENEERELKSALMKEQEKINRIVEKKMMKKRLKSSYEVSKEKVSCEKDFTNCWRSSHFASNIRKMSQFYCIFEAKTTGINGFH